MFGNSRWPCLVDCSSLVISFALGLAAAPAQAAEPADRLQEAVDDAAVRQAIERGAQYLKERQRDDGTWTHQNFSQAMTPLCLYAMLRSGADPQDPLMRKAAAEIKQQPIQQLYMVALQVLALSAAEPREYAEAIQERVDWLEQAQALQGKAAGGWSYTVTADRADGSCSRFALLALHRAAVAGAKIQPHTWQLAESYWLTGQAANGGWGYMGDSSPTVTMTLAGMASLAITQKYTGPATKDQTSAAITKAQEWLSKGFDPQTLNGPHFSFRQYSFHCGERAATLNGNSRLGSSDWQQHWVPALLKDQDMQSGGWTKDAPYDLVNTSLAILCLSPEPEAIKPPPE